MIGSLNAFAVLIPAFNPDDALLELVNNLEEKGFRHILVVNDGSESDEIFSQLATSTSVTVITHSSNKGKGAALKTGFTYLLEKFPESITAVITADADGQHLPKDVLRLAQRAGKSPECFYLGARKFDNAVPLRSELGNRLTSIVLEKAKEIRLSDTQTGLRCYPRKLVEIAHTISGGRYEFELNAIVTAKERGFMIKEVSISTVYIDGNKSSHFKPLLDSLKIYATFSRYLFVALCSVFLDFGLFILFFFLTDNVLLSTLSARSISAAVNFLCNKYIVFRSFGGFKGFVTESTNYFILAISVGFLSAALVQWLYGSINGNIVVTKLLVDTFLFFSSYFFQKKMLFRQGSIH